MTGDRWLTLVHFHRVSHHKYACEIIKNCLNVNKYQAQYSDVDANPKLKLKVTRESEAVKELLFMANGVPYQPRTKLLGGFFCWSKGS